MKKPLKHFSLCIGRELGSGGKEVAATLAKRLDASFYDRELIYHASKESGIAPELFEKADEKTRIKIAGGFFGLGVSIHGAAFPQGGFLCNEELFSIQSEVIRQLSKLHSSVFVGRCADYILREEENVFSVFIAANMDDRIARIAQIHNLTEKEAEEYITQNEKRRSEYYNYYTYKKWGAAASYNMCLNTSVLGVDRTVDIIEGVLRGLYSAE